MLARYVRSENPIWFFNDLVGLPLNDQYYAFFLANVFPYIPQSVYSDPNGINVLSNPVQFSPAGSLPANLYFDDTLTYRIEIRKGPTQAYPLVWLIENYVPGEIGENGTGSSSLTTTNQISNGQFYDISFGSPLAISVAGTYPVAPGWALFLTGSGTATISQYVNQGNNQDIGNPPFALEIVTNGWDTAQLIQTFNNNGALWATTAGADGQIGIISASLTARASGVSNYSLSMSYVPSNFNIGSGYPLTLLSGDVSLGSFAVLNGISKVPVSSNMQLNNVAYIDIIIDLQTTGTLYLSNIQVIGYAISPTAALPTVPLRYQEETIERGVDHLFHYYRNSIIIQPKDDILTGWNFPLNPYQFITTTLTTNTDITSYIADQTILHQELGSQLASGQTVSSMFNNALQVSAVTAATNTRMAIINYIDPRTIRPYWGYNLSSLVKAALGNATMISVRLKARLIYRTSLPPTISSTEPISSWPANSDPVFAAGWTALAPLNDPEFFLTPTNSITGPYSDFPEFSFDGFELPNMSTQVMTLGLVLYTMDNLISTMSSEQSVIFESASLVANDFAIDSPPKTFDEVLRDCQYYYEKSYDQGVVPGTTNTGAGQILVPQGSVYNSTVWNGFSEQFYVPFNTVKRKAPAVVLYSPSTHAVNVIDINLYGNGSFTPLASTVTAALGTYWSASGSQVATKGFNFLGNGTAFITSSALASTVPVTCFGGFQYACDARLGLV